MDSSDDAAVKQTNDDATQTKLSAVRAGYYNDWALEALGGVPTLARRAPIINRGTFARVKAMRSALIEILAISDVPPQLLSLGAGFDSLFWNLDTDSFDKLVEVDHRSVATKKSVRILDDSRLLKRIEPVTQSVESQENMVYKLISKKYVLIGADLRNPSELVQSMVARGVLDPAKPVVVICEVVLVYMTPEDSDTVLRLLTSTFPDSAILNYEMIRPNDDFGKQMVRNIAARRAPLLGVHKYPTSESQELRCFSCGFCSARARPMDDVYNKLLTEGDRARAARCELLDEFEEWNLLMSHYVLVLAATGSLAEKPSEPDPPDGRRKWWASLRTPAAQPGQ